MSNKPNVLLVALLLLLDALVAQNLRNKYLIITCSSSPGFAFQ